MGSGKHTFAEDRELSPSFLPLVSALVCKQTYHTSVNLKVHSSFLVLLFKFSKQAISGCSSTLPSMVIQFIVSCFALFLSFIILSSVTSMSSFLEKKTNNLKYEWYQGSQEKQVWNTQG